MKKTDKLLYVSSLVFLGIVLSQTMGSATASAITLCRNYISSEVIYNNIKFTPISNTVESGAHDIFTVKVKNSGEVKKVIVIRNSFCRCQQHAGSCDAYWPENPSSCNQQYQTLTLKDDQYQYVPLEVTQFQNQAKGSFKLTMDLVSVNAKVVGPELAAKAEVDMCQDALSAPVCSSNSQCGTDGFVGSNFCQSNGVYRNYVSYTCNNPGTFDSFCTSSTSAQLQTTCTASQTCTNGSCNNICTPNASQRCVGNAVYSFDSCGNQGNLVQTCASTQTCTNGSCVNTCTPNASQRCVGNAVYSFDSCGRQGSLIQTCAANQTCSSGSCTNNPVVTCSSNSQCGTNGFVGSPFCQSNGVFKNFVTYTCNNPGTSSSTCTSSTSAQLQTTCQSNQTCSNGACTTTCTSHSLQRCVGNAVYWFDSCGNQQDLSQQCTQSQSCSNASCMSIICSSNNDCGTSGYVDSPYCDSTSGGTGNVYQNYKQYTCNNPGTTSSSCTSVTNARLKQVCLASQTCTNGNCGNVACQQSSDCGTDGFVDQPFCQGGSVWQNHVTYTCNSPGTANALCTNTKTPQLKQLCLGNQTCSNGTCNNINTACIRNTDCGQDGYIDGLFCQGNGVYKNYKTYTCNNPGMSNAYCSNSTSAQLQSTCAANQTCTSGACVTNVNNCTPNASQRCVGNSVYSFDSCGNQGSLIQACTSNQTCNNGACHNMNITCSSNSDCGTNGLIGGNFCQGNAVYRNFITYTCNNPGTANSTCTNSTSAQLQSNCTANQTCTSGACVANATITCSSNSDCGTNGLIGGPFCSGGNVQRTNRTWTCNNPGTANSSCTPTDTQQLQQTCTANQTCTSGACVANATITCSSNSDCGTNGLIGSNFCKNGSVYKTNRTWTCNNPGTANSSCTPTDTDQLQTTCTANQTCSSGACVANATAACNSNSDCGTNRYVDGLFCQNNNVAQNYITYTCNNPGTSSASCSSSVAAQTIQTCQSNQYCSSGACVNSAPTCTQNTSQRCSGNAVYWFDSCGNQGSLIQSCQSGQTCSNGSCTNSCTQNASQRCVGNAVYNYDSCGNQGNLVQACQTNQTCTNGSCINQNNSTTTLVVTEYVRNLSSGNLNFSQSVYANPGDIVEIKIVVQSNVNQTINNVTIRETLPAGLTYNNSLTLDGAAYSGDIINGINIGSVSPGQTRTITFQAQVAQSQYFSFGTTTITDPVDVSSTDPNFQKPNPNNVSIYVTKTGVQGATNVSTGLTNDFWNDSFFLPLMLSLGGIWFFRSNIIGVKRKYKGKMAQIQLNSKIADIKQREQR